MEELEAAGIRSVVFVKSSVLLSRYWRYIVWHRMQDIRTQVVCVGSHIRDQASITLYHSGKIA